LGAIPDSNLTSAAETGAAFMMRRARQDWEPAHRLSGILLQREPWLWRNSGHRPRCQRYPL